MITLPNIDYKLGSSAVGKGNEPCMRRARIQPLYHVYVTAYLGPQRV